MAIAALFDLEGEVADVVGAYLHPELKEEIYMPQPEGFDDGSGRVLKLSLCLCGLKQSGREWILLPDLIFTPNSAALAFARKSASTFGSAGKTSSS